MTDKEREKEEDIYMGFREEFFSRNLTARMNDVRTSVKLNSLLNRASEVFDGETARFRWTVKFARTGDRRCMKFVIETFPYVSNDIQPYCAPYKGGNSNITVYAVTSVTYHLFEGIVYDSCLFFEYTRHGISFLSRRERKGYLYALYFFFFKEKTEIDISGRKRYSRLLAEVQRRKGGGRRGRKTRYILFEFPCNKKKVYTAKFPHPRPFLRIHRIRIESLRGKEKQIKKKLNFNDLYFLL